MKLKPSDIHNILYVNTPRVTGGAEISLLTTIANLNPQRFRPFLLTTPKSLLIDQARSIGIEPYLNEFPWLSRKWPWAYLNSIRQIATLIKNLNISLVHSNCDHSLPYVRRVSRLTHTPYVSHVRDYVRGWFREPYLTALKGAHCVIANSKAVAEECINQGIPPEKVSLIYNAINIARFSADGEDLRGELGIRKYQIVVGIVGQLQDLKGHREFIEASLMVLERAPSTIFLIVGRAPDEAGHGLEKELKQIVSKSRWPDAFRFTGHRDDIDKVMRTLDILAAPSWTEPFGRVAVEAMAAGVAVIGTNVGGLTEIITDGVDGLLVPPRDISTLKQALFSLITQPQLRMKLGFNGQRSASRFSIEQHIELLENLYYIILNNKPAINTHLTLHADSLRSPQ
jgi:glycosyltransferase involved in cell wall biosynthesis